MSATDQRPTALQLSDLSVALKNGDTIVDSVSLELAPGEILGLVGESGSGKTTTALSLLGFTTSGASITAGELVLQGGRVAMDESMRAVRGKDISYVPQDPSRALNPALRVASAIEDIMAAHGRASDENAIATALERVGLASVDGVAARFPHQLSGGQQQRVAIAMSISCQPGVVILDEPTTGLDVVTQARILNEVRRLSTEHQISMVYVTHDLAVVAQISDRIAVMYAGSIVEQGPSAELLKRPRHPYTRGLLVSIPDHVRPSVLEPMPGISLGVGERTGGCAFAPRCSMSTDRCASERPSLEQVSGGHHASCFHSDRTPELVRIPLTHQAGEPEKPSEEPPLLAVDRLVVGHRSGRVTNIVAEDISFTLGHGECLALVGESGSGKTTIARTIGGLHPVMSGDVRLGDTKLPDRAANRTREQRRQIQLVFQNPAAALNPRQTVRDAIGRPAVVLRKMGRSEVTTEVDRLLECVRLPARLADRYPQELSGGERQRVAIARALAADPKILLCDEITSALDVSVQAAVLSLLNELRQTLGLGLLFITHDLGVVATVATRILVLNKGHICESGAVNRVLADPRDGYTRQLLSAAPSISETLGA
jgi:peptide/nickel transport system ATP-binding protein